jgi:lipoprotein-releasing system permease protein
MAPARHARRLSYELRIGWRYLYGGRRDRTMVLLAAVAAAVAIAGGVQLVISHGASPGGVLTLVLGMIACAVFALLAVLSVFTSVSVLGVTLGVAALTVVLAVTTGFQQQFREKVLGVNAHVIVLKSVAGFVEYRDVMKTAREIDPDVLGVQPFIFAEMLVTRGKGELSGVGVKGVDPSLVGSVLDLDHHMVEGSVDVLARTPASGEPPPVIIGKQLAYKLAAKLGDVVTVVQSDFDARRGSVGSRTRKFRVAGIFYVGFDEYDRRLMYVSLHDAQELVGRGDEVFGVELKVKDVDRAEVITKKLDQALGGSPYQVEDWYELNHNLFTALNLQKLALVVILALIVLVAAVNMVSSLFMTVTEKTREIAILKSMGATSRSVAWVFIVEGTAIGAVGTIVGVAIGLVTCHVVSAYGYRLDPKVYLIDRLPIDVRPFEVVLVIVLTMVISLIASIVPALQAAALTPVEGLRYD